MRFEFVHLALKRTVPFRHLAQRFGISAKTGYKWLKRFRQLGATGLVDLSRRPHHQPGRTGPKVEAIVLAKREEYGWGGRHLSRSLRLQGHVGIPAASTCTAILHRHGRISVAATQARQPFQRFERSAPNQLWQMDFKGHVPLLHGGRCHPLTLVDDYSRFCPGLEACANETAQTVQEKLLAIFDRCGLPEAILTDNGAPWGHLEQTYTSFEVWLMRLKIKLCHGRPYHPQTQGKDERFNRTLKHQVLDRYDLYRLRDCQRHFDRWRQVYNFERCHDSLNGQTPAVRYRPSLRSRPLQLPPIAYEAEDLVKKVKQKGEITFKNQTYYVGRAFRHLPIALRPTDHDGCYAVYFCWQQIGLINLTAKTAPKSSYTPINLP